MEMVSTEGAIVLIALYDCAVVSDSFADEPWVQLLVATPTQLQKQYSKGRNPRILHFEATIDGQNKGFEVNPRGICQIARESLLQLDIETNYRVDQANSYDLKQWLAERYRQDTWPDAFNNALKDRERRLKRFWARYNDFISGLYIRLHTSEELEADKYRIAAIVAIESGKERALLHQMRDNNKQLREKSIDEIKGHLASEIIDILGDAVIFEADRTNVFHGKAVEVLGEEQIPIHRLRTFSRFSPYSLSEFGTEAPPPVEMLPAKTTS